MIEARDQRSEVRVGRVSSRIGVTPLDQSNLVPR